MGGPQPDTFHRDQDGRLWVGGLPIGELAERFGTPLYVMDVASIRSRWARYQQALEASGAEGRVFYAAKAFWCTAMAQLLEPWGAGLDVVSEGELYTALKAGFPPERIIVHGNAKTPAELRLAVEARVGAVVVDSQDEIAALASLADSRRPVPVWLRLTPGIEAHTHEFIRTGQFDSKFGLAMADGIAEAARDQVLAAPGLALTGVHAHIGSQVLEVEPFLENARRLMQFCRDSYRDAGFWPRWVNIGGGIGVRYVDGDEPPPVSAVVAGTADILRAMTPSGLAVPQLALEPGRSVVAEAGLTVYRVQATKTVPGGRRYVMVDGGMGDNIRPALYQARYLAAVDAPRPGPALPVTVAGRYCESGDVLIRDAWLPPVERGDLLVVFATGAYTYAMASVYNRVPRPPVVAVEDGRAAVWVDRESLDDVIRLDRPLGSA
jgi:diaminopimelate decarboxylase